MYHMLDQKIVDQKIRDFARKNKINAMHNMYYICSEDKDGNITDEAYALNGCTDAGLQWVYGQVTDYYAPGRIGSTYWSSSSSRTGGWLYLGDQWPEQTSENPNAGTPLDPNFNAMYNSRITIECGWADYDRYGLDDYRYIDIIFNDPYIIGVGRMLYASTEYNYSGITEDFDIVEIGYTSRDTRWNSQQHRFTLHARVVDENGQPSSIPKHVNEKLTIYVYTGYVVPYTIMKNAYDAGYVNNQWDLFSASLLFINPQRLALNTYNYYGAQYGFGPSLLCRDMPTGYSTNTSREFEHFTTFNNPNGQGNWYSRNNWTDDTTNRQVFHHSTSPGILLENPTSYIDHYTVYSTNRRYENYNTTIWAQQDRIISSCADILCTKYIQQPSQDADIIETSLFALNNDYSKKYDNDYTITTMFGDNSASQGYYRGIIPTQYCELLELKMFNVKTNAFDINEQFSFHEDFLMLLEWNHCGFVYMKWPDDKYYNTAVYINPNPHYPIATFSGNETIYATDAWWDVTTWIPIINLQALTSEESQKRYYIKQYSTSNVSLFPRYDAEPRVIPMSTYKEKCLQYNCFRDMRPDYPIGALKILLNDSLRYLVIGRQLIFFDQNLQKTYGYTINGYNGESFEYNICNNNRYCYQNKIVIPTQGTYTGGNDNSTVRIYDVSDPTNAPTYIDLKCNHNTNYSSGFIWQDCDPSNESPYLTFYDNIRNGDNKYCVQVLDVSQSNTEDMVFEIEDAIKPFVIRNSNYLLYQDPTGSVNTFKIYDLVNKQVVETIVFSEAYAGTVKGYVAYSTDGTLNNTYIYITIYNNNTYVVYYYDIRHHEVIVANNVNPCYDLWIQNGYKPQVYGCEHCAIVFAPNYQPQQSNSAGIWLFDPSQPEASSPRIDTIGTCGYLKYINDGKQLIFGHSGGYGYHTQMHVIDIGRYLSQKSLISITTYDDYYPRAESREYVSFMIPYDKGILDSTAFIDNTYSYINYVPIEKFIPHYAKIRTRTFNAYNNPINIDGGIEVTDCETNITSRTQPIV